MSHYTSSTEDSTNRSFIELKNIELALSFKLVCLRHKKTRRIENVSHTVQGLTYTLDRTLKPVYYNPATNKFRPTVWTNEDGSQYLTMVSGDLKPNPAYEVVEYVPENFIDEKGLPLGIDSYHRDFSYLRHKAMSNQLAEVTFLNKAIKIGLFKSSYDKEYKD